ncbi:MAG: CehA/McbA family metallohydrolase [Albidovulum sp.]|nr:CehA/McbA family metallohydrolase [Albidovulum sp.]
MRTFPQTLRPTHSGPSTLNMAVRPPASGESHYLYVPVEIPCGVTRLDVEMTYDRGSDSLVDIGLLDPRAGAFPTQEGFRGWSGGARNSFFVGPGEATPGYVAGEILPGRWMILLGLVSIPDSGLPFRLSARVSSAPVDVANIPEPAVPRHRGPGWYRGDCHAHTFHSDAKGAPEVLHEEAKIAGLDFLFITDHNNTTAWSNYFRSASSEELLFLPGMEITTMGGHANALGISRWVDFRVELARDPEILAQQVAVAGGLLSINHDKPPIPWRHPLPRIDCMEVWQRHWLAANEVSLGRYDQFLRKGRRITAIGGSDYHQPASIDRSALFRLGTPTTVLYCEELSQDGVMRALKSGQGYVTEAPNGPSIILEAEGTGMGGVLPSGSARSVLISISGSPGDEFVLTGDEGEIARQPIDSTEFVSELPVPQEANFVRGEIQARASRKRLLEDAFTAFSINGPPRGLKAKTLELAPLRRALSNPIYFGNWN